MHGMDSSQLRTKLIENNNRLNKASSTSRDDFAFESERQKLKSVSARRLRDALEQAGVDVKALNGLAAKDEGRLRSEFEERARRAQANFGNAPKTISPATRVREDALKLLRNPFLSYYIPITSPMFIYEYPKQDLDFLVGDNVEPSNSWMKVHMNVSNKSVETSFRFVYIWTNHSDAAVVINVYAPMYLHGSCSVFGDKGLESGGYSTLYARTSLETTRWSGWGSDPVTGDGTPVPYQQFQQQYAATLAVSGGWLFGDVGFDAKIFDPRITYDLSYSLLAVPAGATLIFEVCLSINAAASDESSYAALDLANNKFDYNVSSPLVQIQVLSPSASRA